MHQGVLECALGAVWMAAKLGLMTVRMASHILSDLRNPILDARHHCFGSPVLLSSERLQQDMLLSEQQTWQTAAMMSCLLWQAMLAAVAITSLEDLALHH